ncbi:Uncharacterised protein [Vibrio cholerae]|nr:Uncharacterised protein [Vibrio cholerae]
MDADTQREPNGSLFFMTQSRLKSVVAGSDFKHR